VKHATFFTTSEGAEVYSIFCVLASLSETSSKNLFVRRDSNKHIGGARRGEASGQAKESCFVTDVGGKGGDMRTRHWNYGHMAKLTFQQMDRVRQLQGLVLDSIGFAPKETPSRVLHKEAGFRLRRYGDASQEGPAMLIAPAPIKRSYIWDLAPEVSAVRRCLAQGMRVYLAEWMPPEDAEQTFGIADYADRFLMTCVDAIEDDAGQAQVILAGHSLGGTLAAIFSCLHSHRIRGLVLLEAPLHFASGTGKFSSLVAATPNVRFIEESFGNVPGSFLNVVSVASAPSEFQWQRLMDFSFCTPNRDALVTHMRVERWMHDEFPLPGKLFTEIVELLYRNDCLMQGELRVAGKKIGPRDLTAPLLSVVDPRSTIIPPKSIVPFHQAAAGEAKKLLLYKGDVGVAVQHVGVLVGASAHTQIWPAIFDWLSETCGAGCHPS
jgi:polyhydroxyalkanoate synthase